jgi:hypothetical protein
MSGMSNSQGTKPSVASFTGSEMSNSTNISTIEAFDVEDDIAGLSVAGVTELFKIKFMTIRHHLEKMKDHPLMRIIQVFRDALRDYVEQKHQDIQESVSFMEGKDAQDKALL